MRGDLDAGLEALAEALSGNAAKMLNFGMPAGGLAGEAHSGMPAPQACAEAAGSTHNAAFAASVNVSVQSPRAERHWQLVRG